MAQKAESNNSSRFRTERSATETVIACWGNGDVMQVDAWLLALARACDERSQLRTAKQLGYSTSVVSQVLSNKYGADIGKVAEAVRARLMGATVDCPEFGELTLERCLDHQKKSVPPFTSSLRARMHRICQTCSNFRGPRK